ncbi:MAG: bifunctional nuclease family protein [Thermoanaerobaculia bacterium]|nr:bifunctional nuclease family protein [Thermoanaerobaculia bacterium]
MSKEDGLIRMEVKGLMLDPSNQSPIIILRGENKDEFLPIWIGVFEAHAIAMRLEGAKPQRPMTHDLIANLIDQLDVVVESIVVSNLEESTFFAQLNLRIDDRTMTVDSRPSDAIAIALRTDAPIFVSIDVFEKAKMADNAERARDEERLKKWLEEVDPDDLGKYTM